MKQKTLIYMVLKPSIVLAAAVLTASSFLAPSTATAEEPTYLMPTGPGGGKPDDGIQPYDPTGSETKKFLTYGVDPDGEPVPLKTLRITNNTADTVYPIMRDPNSKTLEDSKTVGLYDPYDPANKEYRGYIGYEQGGKFYFGLKTGHSILVRIPLVFWNGARIAIETDGQYLTVKPGELRNPLRYRPEAHRAITNAEENGVVMWYRALGEAEAPADDTKDQLTEMTIRDHDYLANPKITVKTNHEIPDSELVNLINYDVSNVDNLYLPLAMEATDVWVLPPRSGTGPNANRTGYKPGSDPDVYGWTGAIDKIDSLQTKIREFTDDNNELLGRYFGAKRKGWPFYNIPNPTNDPNASRKIPSGANIFPQSPLKNVRSSYGDGKNWQDDKYILSSGGSAPVSATIGWAGGTPDQPGSATLHLNRFDQKEAKKIAFLQRGYLVNGEPPCEMPDPAPCVRLPNPIQVGTTVTDVDVTAGTVTLSKPLVASSEACAFTFRRPVDDYAADAIVKLWYSWAQYYLAHWKDQTPSAPATPTPITGSIDAMTATLTFNEAHPELVKGMAVTGPGLDNAMTEVDRHQGDAVILQIASDKKSVILSQVANKTSKKADNATFTVHPPQSNPLLYTPTAEGQPGYPLIGDKFQFSNEPAWHDPYEFSQQVYLIMASMNQIGKKNNDSVSKYMQDIIGANMGFIFTKDAKASDDGKMVTSMIRDMIKSVLRGVSDFTKYPDKIEDGKHVVWYPNPSLERGNQLFNVFNLDPYVWFVHVKLGFSGYGFSVDDDTADVGAGGASQLQLTVTEKGGLKNTNPWTIQAPYGPVKNVSLPYSGKASSTNGDTLDNAIKSVSDTTPIRITTVGQHNLSNGDTVVIHVGGDPAANGTFKIGNVTSKTFELFDAATGTTPVSPSPNRHVDLHGGIWSYPLHPYIDSGPDVKKVFYRVTGDDALGTFQGTLVSVKVNGVDVDRNPKSDPPGKKFRVWRQGKLDKGRLLLDADLTDVHGTPLPAGTYNFTFFGE